MTPSITIIMQVMPAQIKGVVFGIFLSMNLMMATVAIVLVGFLSDYFGGDKDLRILGRLIAISSVISGICATFCYWKAGYHYVRWKKLIDRSKELNKDIKY